MYLESGLFPPLFDPLVLIFFNYPLLCSSF